MAEPRVLEPDPRLIVEHLTQQLAQKSNEAAQGWACMQQLNQELSQKDQMIEDLNKEIDTLREKLQGQEPTELRLLDEEVGT